MASLTEHEEMVHAALKTGDGPLAVGDVASMTGLERMEALAALKALEGHELATHVVDSRRGERVWIARLDD